MERANFLNVKIFDFPNKRLHLCAVLSHNAEVISPGLVYLVVVVVKATEPAKGIGGE